MSFLENYQTCMNSWTCKIMSFLVYPWNITWTGCYWSMRNAFGSKSIV